MKWLSLLVAVALVVCLVPLAYTQAAEVTGKFTVKPKAPEVTALEIYEDKECTTPASSMTPQVTYYAKASVTQASGLKYLKKVEVYVYYDAGGGDGEPGSPHPQSCALLTWNADPESWSIDAGGSTTWSIVTADCSRPSNLNSTTGDWVFAFVVGKVATETVAPNDWDGKGIATNKADKSGSNYVRDKGMNWYGEVAGLPTEAVDWGEVDPGLLFEQSPNPKTGITATYIANGDYATTIKGTDWTGADYTAKLDEDEVEPPAGDNEFALKANDTNTYSSAKWVKKTDVDINETGTQTTESGVYVSNNTLWLSLSESFEADVYEGTIHYGIRNR